MQQKFVHKGEVFMLENAPSPLGLRNLKARYRLKKSKQDLLRVIWIVGYHAYFCSVSFINFIIVLAFCMVDGARIITLTSLGGVVPITNYLRLEAWGLC